MNKEKPEGFSYTREKINFKKIAIRDIWGGVIGSPRYSFKEPDFPLPSQNWTLSQEEGEDFIFILKKEGGQWRVILEGDEIYPQHIPQAPIELFRELGLAE